MRFFEAFHETLFRFSIKGKDLAGRSGVNEQQISRFRNGQVTITVDSLERLLEAMPPDAKTYLLELVVKSRVS